MSNELDKQISEKLHGYESAVDAEAIWAAVRPPRRRRPWLWLVLLIGMLGLTGAGWWQYNQQLNLGGVVGDSSASTSQITVMQPNSNDRAGNNEVASEHIEQIASSGTVGVSEVEQQTDNTEPRAPSTALVSTEKPLANQSTKTEVARSEITNTTVVVNTMRANKLTEQIAAKKPITESAVPLELNSNKEFELSANAPSTEAETGTTASSANEEYRIALNSIDYRLASLQGLLTTSPKQLDKDLIPLDTYRRSRRQGSPWSVQLDAAYMLLNRKLSSDSLSAWMDNRIATESTLEALSSDLTIGYAFHQNWQLRAGLGYTQINTLFSLNNIVSTVDTVLGVEVIIINPDGSVDSIMGPVAHYETTERSRRVYNSFRQFELPVLLSYESGFGRLSVIGEAGARIRLQRSWEGMIIAPNGEDVLDLTEQNFYRTSIGFSLQAGLHLGYELSPNLQLRAGGTMRYSLEDFSRKNIGFQERYQLVGLQVGLRYSFR